jgi:hypothetical protein
MMAGTAADVIRAAESQLGQSDGAKYFNDLGSPDLGPWCVAFVRWCMAQAGVGFDWPLWVAWDWTDGSRFVAPSDLQAGDAVSFDWDDDGLGDHVGIVKSVHDWGIVTIEGNTDWGHVAEKQRLWSVIICGIRPTYRAKDEWIKADDGRWWYRHSDGSYTTSGWEHIDGEWYYFDAEGWMVTGWVEWGGWWYYLSEWTDGPAAPEGHMVKGGIFADKTGSCYAFYGDGRMVQAGDVTATPSQTHDGTFGRLVTA